MRAIRDGKIKAKAALFLLNIPKIKPNTIISPTLSCGQIRTVLLSGWASFCLLASHHFTPANKAAIKIPPTIFPCLLKI